ncbi:MAG TPA: hypothetical protein VGO63_00120 [Candidatus Paceibacterota bacterium]|jgi:hypothetical protein|nr:hypothetical protein [Candidatus Paceibacterota bacterium]
MKKVLFILSIIILLVPSLVFASWWNPFSWFRKTDVRFVLVNESQKADALTAAKVIHDTQIVEKPVIKTVTVTDPNLEKIIKILEIKNKGLSDKIEELEKIIDNMKEEKNQEADVETQNNSEEAAQNGPNSSSIKKARTSPVSNTVNTVTHVLGL